MASTSSGVTRREDVTRFMVTRSDEESFDVELSPQPSPAVAIKILIASKHGGKAKGGKSQRSAVLPVPNTTTIATNREEDESTETQAGEVEGRVRYRRRRIIPTSGEKKKFHTQK